MIYLHIGLHKTGTSTIQQFAANNTALLAQNRIIYPQIGRQREAHHQLMEEARTASGTRLVDKVAQLALSNPKKDILVSAEGLSILPAKAIRRIVDPLRKVAPLRAIVYIRSSAGRFVSSYNQNSKRSYNLLSFDEYFDWRLAGREIEQVIVKWGRVIGYDAIRVRTLEKAALVGSDLLADFCAAIGMDGALDQASPESLQPTNMAVSWEVAEFVREFSVRAANLLQTIDRDSRLKLLQEADGSSMLVTAKHTKERGVRLETIQPRQFPEFCEEVLARLGPISTAQYLTPDQAERLEDNYRSQLDAIGERVEDARLDHTAPELLPPRPFEPTFDAIDPTRREAIRAAVQQRYRWGDDTPLLRQLIEGMR